MNMNTFRSFLHETTEKHTFPISLTAQGWRYGMKGDKTTTITSVHPPGKANTFVTDGHPHHIEELMRQQIN